MNINREACLPFIKNTPDLEGRLRPDNVDRMKICKLEDLHLPGRTYSCEEIAFVPLPQLLREDFENTANEKVDLFVFMWCSAHWTILSSRGIPLDEVYKNFPLDEVYCFKSIHWE